MNGGPTVVLSLLDDVDLVSSSGTIKSAWSMLGLKHEVRTRLEIQTLRVAMTKRPDLGPRVLPAHERIVLRHRAVVVQAKCFAGQRIELLGQVAVSRVAGSDVQLPVRSETYATAGMSACRRQILHNHFAIDQTLSRFAIAHDTHTQAATCVSIRKIDKLVTVELRV